MWSPTLACPAELGATPLTRVPTRPGPRWLDPDRTVPGRLDPDRTVPGRLALGQTPPGRLALNQALPGPLPPGQPVLCRLAPGLMGQSRTGVPVVLGLALRVPSPAGWTPAGWASAGWASTARAPTVVRSTRRRRLVPGPPVLDLRVLDLPVLGPAASPPAAESGRRPATGVGRAAAAAPEWGSRRGRAWAACPGLVATARRAAGPGGRPCRRRCRDGAREQAGAHAGRAQGCARRRPVRDGAVARTARPAGDGCPFPCCTPRTKLRNNRNTV
jgi:hypothetical protein